ncbi:MAG: transcription factor E [Candidatus Hodarchaeota archaeon]
MSHKTEEDTLNLIVGELENKLDDKTIGELDNDTSTDILNILNGTEEVTDEELAEKSGMRLNIVRKILYKLYDNRLASYRRVRDKNTGWFVYFWKLNPERIFTLVKKKKTLVLQRLKERLDYEKENTFYQCDEDNSSRFTFDEAMEITFRCPKCGGPLKYQKNRKLIRVLEQKIKELEKDL